MIDSGETVWKTPHTALTSREELALHLRERPWKRLAITMIAPIVYFALTRIPIPSLDERLLNELSRLPYYDPASTSICALGIAPVISAFYVVELIALIVPRWNRLRTGGHPERRQLAIATYLLAGLFALIQGWAVASNLAAQVGDSSIIPATMLSTFATTALLVGLAVWIDHRGLGGGWAVLIGAGAVPVAYDLLWAGWVAVRRNLLSAAHVALIIALLGGVVAITVYLLKLGRTRTSGLVMRVPASGILPLGMAAALLTIPAETLQSLRPTQAWYWISYLVLSVILAVVMSWLFNRPTQVGDMLTQVTGEDREKMWGLARSQLGAVTTVSTSYLAGIVLVSGFLGWLVSGALFVDVVLTVVMTALILDLIAEWRFRRVFPRATSAWPIHRVYAVAPALLVLERAGIPAHPRSLRQRTLYQFFGPEVPIDLMVPAEKLEEARALLARALR